MNQKGESFLEILSLVVMAALLIVCWLLDYEMLKWWFWFFVGIGLSVGAIELISKLVTGKTISQQFWAFSEKKDAEGKYKNTWKAIAVLGSLLAGWVMLLVHLGWKMMRREK